MKQFLFALFIASVLILPRSMPAVAEDAVVAFTNARNAFDAGDFKEAASRFEELLEEGMDNEALQLETHKYLGVCYIFISEPQKAEDQFLKLLNLDPDFNLDPLVFPIDVVDFFTAVRAKHSLALKKIAEAEAKAEEAKRREEEQRRQEEIERLRTTVYVQKQVKWHSRLVTAMPFGAGQFQNGHYKKGIFFFSGELLLMSASIVTFMLHENLRRNTPREFYSKDSRKENEDLEQIFRLTNQICLGALGGMALVGIIDAIYYFKPKTVTFKKIEEEDVPEHLRQKKKKPQAAITPWFDGQSAGIGAIGYF